MELVDRLFVGFDDRTRSAFEIIQPAGIDNGVIYSERTVSIHMI